MSISNLLQSNFLNIYCGTLTKTSNQSQIINLSAEEFVIPSTTVVNFTPSMGFYLPPATSQPTSITFFYKEGGGGSTDAYVEIRSISNVPVTYFKNPVPTDSNTAIIMTADNPLPLTSNLLMLGFSANSAGAGSLFPISLHITY